MIHIITLLSVVQSFPSRAIGVVMQPDNSTSLHIVPSSVIKLIEMNGFQAVPIFLNKTVNQTLILIQKLNGIVFSFQRDTFNKAQQLNLDRLVLQVQILYRNGITIPFLAIGNGLNKLFTIFVSETTFVSGQVDTIKNLTILKSDGVFFGNMDKSIIDKVQSKGLFYFNVVQGVLSNTILNNPTLSNIFEITSITKDGLGRNVAATLQGKTAPFYGILFSPEANIFEYRLGQKGAEHSMQGVVSSQQLLNGFFEVSRKQGIKISQSQLSKISFLNYQVTPGNSIYSWYII